MMKKSVAKFFFGQKEFINGFVSEFLYTVMSLDVVIVKY